MRYGPVLTPDEVALVHFTVHGSQSGGHTGRTIVADDHRTVIFKPASPFTPGEQVTIGTSRLSTGPETIFGGLAYTFTVATNQGAGSLGTTDVPSDVVKSAFPGFLTVPQDIPHFTVSGAIPDGEGDIFAAPFYWTKSTLGSYLLILNHLGQLVYYQPMAQALAAYDFKVQPNGLLSYYDQKDATYNLMDSHYRVVGQYRAGNGYTADLHDFQLLPNGNALLMAYDAEMVDMSRVVAGGVPTATVTGLVVQELDPSQNVILEWRSWDHFAYTDTTVSLTTPQIDLVHGNALALANDGNLLLSSRNLSEITKIDLQTGAVIWRLGGKSHTLQLIGGQPFAFQHDVRQLPNGDITVFDNQGSAAAPAASMGLEYRVDAASGTATRVWQFTHLPPVFATFMGDAQRLATGNTFIGWGAASTDKAFSYVSMTEVAPDGRVLFDLAFDPPFVSYRAFRFPWQGFPDTLPALAARVDASGITLGYSWNGATEVSAYRVYGGSAPQALKLIEVKPKTDFETQSHLAGLPPDECYFQVAALDGDGRELARSKVISTDSRCPLAAK